MAQVLSEVLSAGPWILLGLGIYFVFVVLVGRRLRRQSPVSEENLEAERLQILWAEHVEAHAKEQRGAVTLVPPGPAYAGEVRCYPFEDRR